MARQIEASNRYGDVLLKLIPTEIVGAYMVTDGFIPPGTAFAKWIALGAGGFLLVITPFYLHKLYKVHDRVQIFFTTASFVVWVYWMGGPFKLWGIHSSPLASVILVLWTLLVPLVNLPKKFNKGQTVQILTKKPVVVPGKYSAVIWDEEMKRNKKKWCTGLPAI